VRHEQYAKLKSNVVENYVTWIQQCGKAETFVESYEVLKEFYSFYISLYIFFITSAQSKIIAKLKHESLD